ncbi:MAG: HD domain-containing protein [Streptomycetaceae bacterium]|nr:HD domain-containing protein [Streptomycetaceae bacterium]
MASEALHRALADTTDPDPRPLPDRVEDLLRRIDAPPRLAAHLRLVHDVAWRIVAWVEREYPDAEFDREAVLFGAATHDIGKATHPEELSAPGHAHQLAGYELLGAEGVEADFARFTCTHATWSESGLPLEDLLVSLADKVWKGARITQLEDLVVAHLAAAGATAVDTNSGAVEGAHGRANGRAPRELWAVFAGFDDLLGDLAADADLRLAFQARHPITAARPLPGRAFGVGRGA